MDEDTAKKVKIGAAVALALAAAAVWAYGLRGGGAPAGPATSAKAEALKAGYEKVERPPAEDPGAAPPQPSKGPRKLN